MKKIILTIALSVSMFSFAQDKILVVKTSEPIGTISANVNLGLYGVSLESQNKEDLTTSGILNINYGTMVVSHGGVDYRGNGYSIEVGGRRYLGESGNLNEKLYLESLFSYTRLKFTDVNYSGIHDYFTPLNVSLGYKFRLGKHLVIDPSIGGIWKIEIMPKGNLDNKDFNNWLLKAGVKIGYRF